MTDRDSDYMTPREAGSNIESTKLIDIDLYPETIKATKRFVREGAPQLLNRAEQVFGYTTDRNDALEGYDLTGEIILLDSSPNKLNIINSHRVLVKEVAIERAGLKFYLGAKYHYDNEGQVAELPSHVKIFSWNNSGFEAELEVGGLNDELQDNSPRLSGHVLPEGTEPGGEYISESDPQTARVVAEHLFTGMETMISLLEKDSEQDDINRSKLVGEIILKSQTEALEG